MSSNITFEDMFKNKFTEEDLKNMQAWPLDKKIKVSETRILEWYSKWEGKVYVSFSGGKDSTVLADLVAKVCKVNGYKLVLWFSNTGLEYPEIVNHVKQFPSWIKDKYGIDVELIIDYPRDLKTGKRVTFKDVILERGYPVISKEVSRAVAEVKKNEGTGKITKGAERILGLLPYKNGKKNKFDCSNWKFLLDAPFKISDVCCREMKKKPAHSFEKRTGLKPIIGTMASESLLRRTHWLRLGCNVYIATRPESKPLSFWTEQDALEYIVKNEIPIASVYGGIIQNKDGKYSTTGCERTGCVYCALGAHMEKEPNRFQRLKEAHPKLWEYCMKPVSDGGLGMKEVLEYIGVKYE